jgi:hypothetical protein
MPEEYYPVCRFTIERFSVFMVISLPMCSYATVASYRTSRNNWMSLLEKQNGSPGQVLSAG